MLHYLVRSLLVLMIFFGFVMCNHLSEYVERVSFFCLYSKRLVFLDVSVFLDEDTTRLQFFLA